MAPYNSAYTGAQIDAAVAKALAMPQFKGEVANFAALPAAGTAGNTYLVLNGTGVWPFNRKSAGFYRDDGASWVHMGWDISSLQTDSNWAIRDNTDNTKLMKFEVGSISTGTTRTATMPDKDITLADDADIPVSGVDFDPVGTDNSTDVTLAGTPNYLTIAGQVITRALINLASHVTGTLPIANGGTGATTAAGARTALDVDQAGTDNSTDVTLAGTPDYITISGQVITRNAIDLTTDVTGDLPVADGGTGASDAAGAKTNLGFITDLVDDTTPQLGGALDGQGRDLNNLGVAFLTEQAAAEADVAGKGQWWVQTATPNRPMFTDDTGQDFELLWTVFGGALSDETSDLTTGQKFATDLPFDFTVTRVYASVTTAPTGSAVTVDVEDEGVSILNAVISIAASTNNAETSSFTGATSSYAFSKGDLLTIDIDSVGSTTAGAGLKVYIEGYRT